MKARPGLVLGALAAVLLGGTLLRNALGLEWSATSIRDWVQGLGGWGPLFFVILMTFRWLVLIPSPILLVASGIAFGTGLGSVYGALGLTFAAMAQWGLVRWAGAESVLNSLPPPHRRVVGAIRSRAGSGVVGVISAYPIGPISLVHVGAAIAGMTLVPFSIAVAAGSAVRAATFSFFGSALLEGEGLLAASVVLAAAFAIPLAIPRSRHWLRATFRAPEGESPQG